MVSRLVAQKGTELLRDVFKALADEEINLFILGEGEQEYCTFLEEQTEKYNNFAFFQGYDERLSRETYLASDFLLMPSLFEPCGLNQFIAMRQGSIPVVHAVGGLRDSVHESQAICGRGITHEGQNPKEFLYAVERACLLYEEKKEMKLITAFNLACDFSFDKSAKAYYRIYRELI
jgi:starch synthase